MPPFGLDNCLPQSVSTHLAARRACDLAVCVVCVYRNGSFYRSRSLGLRWLVGAYNEPTIRTHNRRACTPQWYIYIHGQFTLPRQNDMMLVTPENYDFTPFRLFPGLRSANKDGGVEVLKDQEIKNGWTRSPSFLLS